MPLFSKVVAVEAGELVLLRHGITSFNKDHYYSGQLMHILLDPEGAQKSIGAGERCAAHGFTPDEIHESPPVRVTATTDGMITGAGWDPAVIRIQSRALIERCYGRFTGQQRPAVGTLEYEDYMKFHRNPYGKPAGGQTAWGWFEGESLFMCRERVAPYFQSQILPKLLAGRHILVVLHGNSLRALTWSLDHLTDPEIEALEIPWAEPIGYRFEPDGRVKESFLIRGDHIESTNGSWWQCCLRER